jgi:hypothetical protein
MAMFVAVSKNVLAFGSVVESFVCLDRATALLSPDSG